MTSKDNVIVEFLFSTGGLQENFAIWCCFQGPYGRGQVQLRGRKTGDDTFDVEMTVGIL